MREKCKYADVICRSLISVFRPDPQGTLANATSIYFRKVGEKKIRQNDKHYSK